MVDQLKRKTRIEEYLLIKSTRFISLLAGIESDNIWRCEIQKSTGTTLNTSRVSAAEHAELFYHLLISFWPHLLQAWPVCVHCAISSNLILQIQTRAMTDRPGRQIFNFWEQMWECCLNNTLAHMLAALTISNTSQLLY